LLRARESARGRAWQENLQKVDGAKEQYALEQKVGQDVDITSWDNLVDASGAGTGYLKAIPECAATTANYEINAIGTAPTCAYSDDAAENSSWSAQHTLDGKVPGGGEEEGE